MARKNGLGKGLDALFLDNTTEDGAVTSLKITQIEPNKNQPRTQFDDAALRELADSIREHGIIQPLIVRPVETGGYQIVAGERRWRASRMLGLSEVPVIIREFTDAQTLEIAIIENLQREDLNVVELAMGYKALIEEHGMTQEQVADKLGKSRPVIANTIRLLSLPESVLEQVRSGAISRGHAKALLALEDDALIEQTAQRILKEGLLVRDVEKLARDRKKPPKPKKEDGAQSGKAEGEPAWGDSYHREMELALSTELGRRVKITSFGKKCTLEIDFYSDTELAELAARLAKTNW